MCGDIVIKPLKLIFKQALITGEYRFNWKKGNIVPAHKKCDEQNIKNYRIVSLLSICGNDFERILFNSIFSFFLENNFITHKQSRFKSDDSFIKQSLSITREIYKSFDDEIQVRNVF